MSSFNCYLLTCIQITHIYHLKNKSFVLAIINSAAMNIGGHVSLSILVSSVCMPRSGIAGSELPYDPDFILGGSKITADGDCSHEIKRRLLLGRKVMTNLGGIFKSRDITSPSKVHLVKAMVFPVVMYGCESWTIKKAECQRIDALNCDVGEDS